MKFSDIFKGGKQAKIDDDLLIAINRGDNAAAIAALENGASSNAKDTNTIPAIIVAASQQNAEVVAALIGKGADINTTGTDKEKKVFKISALHAAAANGSRQVAELLLAAGAKVDRQEGSGLTPLMSATYMGHSDVVELLLRKGADMEKKDDFGYTPLMFAANNGKMGPLKILLARGAVVDSKDKDNSTPIMFAAQHGFTDIVALLLQHGADKNYKGTYQRSAVDFARQNSRFEVLDLFMKQP